MRISDWSSDVCSSDLHRRLLDDALAPQGAFVAVPALAIAGQPRRDRPDPPVERGRNFFARAVDIMARIVVLHEQGVVESAGDEQPRKGAHPGPPAPDFIRVQAGMAKASGRFPADRPALAPTPGA